MSESQAKIAYIRHAKALLREDLRKKTWPEKVRAGFRLAEARRKAQEGMRRTPQPRD